MWLPETGVDLETLDILAEHGIRFTILSPHQASRVRPVGSDEWHDVTGQKIDSTTAYTLHFPSGRTIALFFYDRQVSRAVAFEKLLNSGESFAQTLLGKFSEARNRPQIVHIATDGESYGHHHRFGDMALAYALNRVESGNLANLTNYGEYLEKHPPAHEVEILENTSWSCAHGVERWRTHCGCNTGSHPQWNQNWRKPLRDSLDWLRDSLAPAYEEKTAGLFKDPWKARNEYVRIIIDRSHGEVDKFLEQHALRTLSQDEKTTALKLLELQRHAMLMYTSCAWFFDELSGIETVQIMQYAGRAIQLAREVSGEDLESGFLERLEQAKSNIPTFGNGRRIFENSVKPAMVDLKTACAYYAVSSLFDGDSEQLDLCCYSVEREDGWSAEAGNARLVVGKTTVKSEITWESGRFYFGVLHLGDHNINCGVKEYQRDETYRALLSDLSRTYDRADIPETLRLMDKHFGTSTYSLKSLYRDEQQRILNLLLGSTLKDVEAVYRKLYEQHAPVLRFLKDSQNPPPRILFMAAELVVNADLRLAFEEKELDFQRIENLLEAAKLLGVSLEQASLEYVFRRNVERMAELLSAHPTNLALLEKLDAALDLGSHLPFRVNLWEVQNICYAILKSTYPPLRMRAGQGDERAREWIRRFSAMGEKLLVRINGEPLS
jgi:alpha-amylase/alpha-mannosidase (GH57 family)